MNQKNFEYLRDQVKFTGFGEGMESELKEKVQQGTAAFDMVHQRKFGSDDTTAILHFQRGKDSDMYFFNNYELSVKQAHLDTEAKQVFYVGKENTFTLKEAYNLLRGQSIFKELNKLQKVGEGEQARYKPTEETYMAWVQLDFKNSEANGNFKMKYYRESHGFDLETALAALPIKELKNQEEKEKLVQSLQKGNRQSVTFLQEDGNELKRYIEANPQHRAINVYDANQKRVRVGESQEENAGERQGKSKQKTVKENLSGDDDTSERKNSRKSKQKGQEVT